jgi:hypothetical protein
VAVSFEGRRCEQIQNGEPLGLASAPG